MASARPDCQIIGRELAFWHRCDTVSRSLAAAGADPGLVLILPGRAGPDYRLVPGNWSCPAAAWFRFAAVRSPPADLGPARMTAALAEGWHLHPALVDYVPEGGGSSPLENDLPRWPDLVRRGR